MNQTRGRQQNDSQGQTKTIPMTNYLLIATIDLDTLPWTVAFCQNQDFLISQMPSYMLHLCSKYVFWGSNRIKGNYFQFSIFVTFHPDPRPF